MDRYRSGKREAVAAGVNRDDAWRYDIVLAPPRKQGRATLFAITIKMRRSAGWFTR
jgi:hypothetical protein